MNILEKEKLFLILYPTENQGGLFVSSLIFSQSRIVFVNCIDKLEISPELSQFPPISKLKKKYNSKIHLVYTKLNPLFSSLNFTIEPETKCLLTPGVTQTGVKMLSLVKTHV